MLLGLETDTSFLDHRCARAVHLALDAILLASNTVDSPVPLSLRAGVHVGRVMTGVVGKEAPRFVLLGEGVEVARALLGKSEAGRARVSRLVFSQLEKNLDFVSEEAGWIVCAVG